MKREVWMISEKVVREVQIASSGQTEYMSLYSKSVRAREEPQGSSQVQPRENEAKRCPETLLFGFSKDKSYQHNSS